MSNNNGRKLTAAEIQQLKMSANSIPEASEVTPSQVENVSNTTATLPKKGAIGLGALVEQIIEADPGIKREEIPLDLLTQGKQLEMKKITDPREIESAKLIVESTNDALSGEKIGNFDNLIESAEKRIKEKLNVQTEEINNIAETAPAMEVKPSDNAAVVDIKAMGGAMKEGKKLELNDDFDLDKITSEMVKIENKTKDISKEDAKKNVISRFGQEAFDAVQDSFNEYAEDFKTVMSIYTQAGMTGDANSSDNKTNKPTVNTTVNEAFTITGKKNVLVSDMIKGLRKRGTSAIGYLPSSNLVIKVYSIDSPFVKEKIQREYQDYQLTGFRDRALLIEILSRVEIIAANAEFEPEELEKIIHLADLEDLIMITLQSSNKYGIIKNYPIICQPYTQEEIDKVEEREITEEFTEEMKKKAIEEMTKYDCNKKYDMDLNINDVIASAVTGKIMNGFRSYNRLKTVDTLMKEGVAGKSYQASFEWEEKEYDVVIDLAPPTLHDYFSTVRDIKQFVIDSMLEKENVRNYIIKRNQTGLERGLTPFEVESMDDQLRELASVFRMDVAKLSEDVQLLIYITGITLYPFEYSKSVDADISRFLDSIISITRETNTLNDIRTLMMDLPAGVLTEILYVVEEMELDDDRPNRRSISKCPHCGKTNIEEFLPSTLFFGWALKGLKEAASSRKKKTE